VADVIQMLIMLEVDEVCEHDVFGAQKLEKISVI
jgi:hypothetical protein